MVLSGCIAEMSFVSPLGMHPSIPRPGADAMTDSVTVRASMMTPSILIIRPASRVAVRRSSPNAALRVLSPRARIG